MTEPEQSPSVEETSPSASAPEVAKPTEATSPAADASVAPAADPAAEATPETPAKGISIGSQRDAADKSMAPTMPKAVADAVANPVNLIGGEEPEAEPVVPAQVLSSAGLGDDIDAEIEAALGGISMDEVVAKTETADDELELNAKVQGLVTKIFKDSVFFKLNGQFEGVAALHTFKEMPVEGETLPVTVRGLNKEDGLYELTVAGAVINVSDWDQLEEGAVVEAKVTAVNTGGLEASLGSIRGFIPGSQVSRYRVEDLTQFVDKKLQCVIVECNPDKRKLVMSHRAVLEREMEEKRKTLMEELEVGQIREGVVTKILDFGAFVDIGGAEGLIHISKISWTRVRHPSEVMSEGEKVKVKVDKIGEDGKIGLSHRDTLEHPWHSADSQLNEEDIITGTVTKLMEFGAFVEIAPGIEGLIHISELAHHRVSKVSTVINEGDKVEVKVLSVDKDKQKVSLSRKACMDAPSPKGGGKKEAVEDTDLPPRELAVKSSGEPLQGGTNRTSGGESVGLKW